MLVFADYIYEYFVFGKNDDRQAANNCLKALRKG